MYKIYFNAVNFRTLSSNAKLMGTFDDIDFDGNGSSNNHGDGGEQGNDSDGGDKGDGSDKPNPQNDPHNSTDINDGSNKDIDNEPDKKDKGEDGNTSTGGLEVGTEFDFEGNRYKVAENGDIVDKDGKVFKAAANVEEWMKTLDVDDKGDDKTLSIDSIKEAIGTNITDENGKPVEFDNTPEGISNYVNSVIELKSNEIRQATINKFLTDNPVVTQFVNYLAVNNGDPRGFGELPDRSGIVVDENNEDQQIAIIKAAAAEFGNSSLNDTYIKYLKDSGALVDEAKAQLANLQAADKQRNEDMAVQAAHQRELEEQQFIEYWTNIKNVIDKRVIGKFKLPDTFVRNVDGQKYTVTPDDFFKYLYQTSPDKDGNYSTDYERALGSRSEEEAINNELLNAWLMFTGGTVEDLVNMAIREKEVKTLKLKAKENNGRGTIRIVKPAKQKSTIDDVILN